MKKNIFLLGCFILVFSFAKAQLSEGGIPAGFTIKEHNTDIPAIRTPALDMEQIAAEDAVEESRAAGYRFGIDFYYSYSIEDTGIRTTLPTGEQIWQLKIICENARSISFTFDRYKLPEGGKLFAYSADKREILGAFTDKNNQEDGYFAVSLIAGDEIIIEYNHPATASFFPELRLWRITHGYRGPGKLLKGFGNSGSCQVNVKCPDGDGWEEQIRSVCAILDGGVEMCTGALVNNVNNDGKPYILTANHCYSYPGTWVFWFNWQSEECHNPPVSPAKDIMSGATLKARYATSDFCLVLLNQTPPASYKVYYSGWSRSTEAPLLAVCIHHPSIDIKKISKAHLLSKASYNGQSYNTWLANWMSAACTEPGSSGSPLFDENKRIIGQLWGGESYCGAPTSKMHDNYGRFDLSWNGGGSSSSALKDWLDPDNTNARTLDGYDPDASSQIANNQRKEHFFTIFPNPASTRITLRFDENDNAKKTLYLTDITGKTILTTTATDQDFNLPLTGYVPGVYFLKVTANDKVATQKLVIQ